MKKTYRLQKQNDWMYEGKMQSDRKWVEKRGEKNQRATEMENVYLLVKILPCKYLYCVFDSFDNGKTRWN